jgi:hypothetical protein
MSFSRQPGCGVRYRSRCRADVGTWLLTALSHALGDEARTPAANTAPGSEATGQAAGSIAHDIHAITAQETQ